jgi:Rho GTPase-activating protein 21/23
VPLLVAKCTKIVETKGLGIVGIYRIPGNTAAISNLNELINRNGLDEQTLSDPKWEDVNVVSSLLKLFIRSLPEPILPNELYGSFIEADKLSDQAQRFHELKTLLRKLPQHNYETLKHLIEHLTTVSKNAAVNLMEPRNLGESIKTPELNHMTKVFACSNRVWPFNREKIQRFPRDGRERHETSVSNRRVADKQREF